jgi:hypothetical protein
MLSLSRLASVVGESPTSEVTLAWLKPMRTRWTKVAAESVRLFLIFGIE